MIRKSKFLSIFVATLVLISTTHTACADDFSNQREGYIAERDTTKSFFDALSSRLKKPVIVSAKAARKRLSGNFDLSNPQLMLNTISTQLSLIWYQDGQAVFVYDASEIKNAIISLRLARVEEVNRFLQISGIYDSRYPLKAEPGRNTFYVSGPPGYIDTVAKVAASIDQRKEPASQNDMVVIPLFNTFVDDRNYQYRDTTVTIPGLATVVRDLVGNMATSARLDNRKEIKNEDPTLAGLGEPEIKTAVMPEFPDTDREQPFTDKPKQQLVIVADPGNNSLLVRGAAEQVDNVRQLVSMLDVPKRHIELGVWIVDMKKEEAEQLGANWSGRINLSNQFAFSLNGGVTSTVDGAKFIAEVLALTQKNRANIVSRPVILTQENVPAIFDNSRTFYTQLIGERSVELDHITYGTSVNVLPRFTKNNEIEMMLRVEDGSNESDDNDKQNLPEVGRTNISTVARVPHGKSLLIGGYTRRESSDKSASIPGLSSIPWIGSLFKYRQSRDGDLVRLFLIQPREILSENIDGNTLLTQVSTDIHSPVLVDWMQNFMENR